jgi:hypothetical protein
MIMVRGEDAKGENIAGMECRCSTQGVVLAAPAYLVSSFARMCLKTDYTMVFMGSIC